MGERLCQRSRMGESLMPEGDGKITLRLDKVEALDL